MKYLIGIDLGTTSLKVSLFALDGQRIGSSSKEYPILVPEPGYAEQDPREWWQALVACCADLGHQFPQEFSQAAGIGICGQMHTQVYLDDQNRLLRPAITWMDQRTREIVERFNEQPGVKDLINRSTANAASTTYSALHIRWVKENQPEIWKQVRSILIAKDYLKFLLTGVKAIDYAEASGTLLFDVINETWSQEMFDLFEIPREFLPEVSASDQIIGNVTPEAARQTGLPAGIPVVNGSSDNSASALGAGMVSPGQVTMIIGTAGVITVCSDHPLVDEKNQTLCWHYCLPNRWATLGITQTAGESLQWFKNAFDHDSASDTSSDIFNQYNELIREVPAGSKGLIFLPYLNGERTPHWDPNARGVFFGVNLETTKAHFIKAIMEGVSFALRHNIETVENLGIQINELRAVGGGLKSPIWLETLARITRKPVATVTVSDTANLGNILLCAKALGLIDSYEDAVNRMVATGKTVSYPEGLPVYEQQYQIYKQLYQDLRQTFRNAISMI
jgi:xylulokinase